MAKKKIADGFLLHMSNYIDNDGAEKMVLAMVKVLKSLSSEYKAAAKPVKAGGYVSTEVEHFLRMAKVYSAQAELLQSAAHEARIVGDKAYKTKASVPRQSRKVPARSSRSSRSSAAKRREAIADYMYEGMDDRL